LKTKSLEWAVRACRAEENLLRNVWIKNPTKKWPRRRLHLQRCIDGVKKNISDTDESKRLDGTIDWNGWRSLLEAMLSFFNFINYS